MKLNRTVLVMLALALSGGLVAPDSAMARGGGGKGGGGRGGKGKGGKRGKGKDGKQMDRKGLIAQLETEMRESDRDERMTDGRKDNFDEGQRERREEVLARHRRRGEDARRATDSRNEVSR
jgi:hypothetical protein